ncbi:hypothetical protein Lser_V15G28610 [Lactuca serriola]
MEFEGKKLVFATKEGHPPLTFRTPPIYEHDVGSLDKSKQTSDDGKDNTWLCFFQATQDAELAVTSNISPEGVEKTGAPTDTASPSSMQVAAGGGGGVSPLMSMADNAAAIATSLRMNPVIFNVDNVRVAKLVGGGLHNCTIVRGMVLKGDIVGSIEKIDKAKLKLGAVNPDDLGYIC